MKQNPSKNVWFFLADISDYPPLDKLSGSHHITSDGYTIWELILFDLPPV